MSPPSPVPLFLHARKLFCVARKLLRNVPGTVLWLLDGGATARANIRGNARRAGVAEERIVFAPLVEKTEHLRRIRLADLFVDTPVRNTPSGGGGEGGVGNAPD